MALAKKKTVTVCICQKHKTDRYELWREKRGGIIFSFISVMAIVALMVWGDYWGVVLLVGTIIACTIISGIEGHSVKCSVRSSLLRIFNFFGSPMP